MRTKLRHLAGAIHARGAIPRGLRWVVREVRFRWRWRRYPSVVAIINPHPAPDEAVERLRQRVISDDWDTP